MGLTWHKASRRKWMEAQRLLTRMNCVITEAIRGFSIYPMNYGDVNYESFINKIAEDVGINVVENPGINWYKSTLFRFEVLGSLR